MECANVLGLTVNVKVAVQIGHVSEYLQESLIRSWASLSGSPSLVHKLVSNSALERCAVRSAMLGSATRWQVAANISTFSEFFGFMISHGSLSFHPVNALHIY